MAGTSTAQDAPPSPLKRRTSPLLTYAQLLRLPNVFTAVADVMMGYLVSRGSLEPGHWFGLLLASSAALYLAGMVLNDVFDAEIDARQRPERPIPSGRVSVSVASGLGYTLLGCGFALAAVVGMLAGSWRPVVVATLLAGAIFLYDVRIKNTGWGPPLMGACRTLNVLLGMSLAPHALDGILAGWHASQWTIAVAIGIYIAGVTWFARTEDRPSQRGVLLVGTGVMLVGLGMVGLMPVWTETARLLVVQLSGWYLFWAVLALVIARRCVLAIMNPSPRRVQAAVKHAILSLIVVDAGICLGFCGVFWGCAVLLLLAPAFVLGHWVYST